MISLTTSFKLKYRIYNKDVNTYTGFDYRLDAKKEIDKLIDKLITKPLMKDSYSISVMRPSLDLIDYIKELNPKVSITITLWLDLEIYQSVTGLQDYEDAELSELRMMLEQQISSMHTPFDEKVLPLVKYKATVPIIQMIKILKDWEHNESVILITKELVEPYCNTANTMYTPQFFQRYFKLVKYVGSTNTLINKFITELGDDRFAYYAARKFIRELVDAKLETLVKTIYVKNKKKKELGKIATSILYSVTLEELLILQMKLENAKHPTLWVLLERREESDNKSRWS